MGTGIFFSKIFFLPASNPESANEKAKSGIPLPKNQHNQPKKYELKKRCLSPI